MSPFLPVSMAPPGCSDTDTKVLFGVLLSGYREG
jgi:hypothetical protein